MNRITVVLHRAIYARNIGMCARAMANMGIDRLVLIAPRCDHLSEEGRQGAAHAQSILREAVTYDSQHSFLESEGEGIRIALSGRDGRLKRPDSLDRVLDRFIAEPEHMFHDPGQPIYLLFGPEDDGLSNEEMELANHICRLPTFGEITSLNLSHAVLLTTYLVRAALNRTPARASVPAAESQSAIEKKAAYYPSETIKRWLEALGFDLSARRVNIEKTLNRILLSRCPTREELRILDTVLQQTVRKLKNRD